MAVELTNTLENLGIALGLGLLVGLQRERAASELAGFRTFPLVTVLGVLCAILDQGHGRWLTAASLLALTALVTGGNLLRRSEPRIDPGLTTEVALLVMFCVGACLVHGHRSVAVVVGVALLASL
ncbi:MAG TPA: MgtC/SapB family protein [Verrucomicrobiota bacterium]|nr:MgtC/SapB family protein [Verrucomicrobiota bacterium]HNU49571.1 MgtC/SapB family protein [Verrucomicrobiota bacterium]